MMILAEGVSGLKEINKLWPYMLKDGPSPCYMIDQIGLDPVAFIEDNYVSERHLDTALTVDWLRQNYIKQGRVGAKSSKGRLYLPAEHQTKERSEGLAVYLLDVGLGANVERIELAGQRGSIWRSTFCQPPVTLVLDLKSPDGIDISVATGRMFWTKMGLKTSTHDRSVMSAKLNGSDLKPLIPEGKRGDYETTDKKDMTRWCVGTTIDTKAGKFYWTQKGPCKDGEGRIFRASFDILAGENTSDRSDIEMIFADLPEAVDLEIHPIGNTLNRGYVAAYLRLEDVNEPLFTK
ncbi:hypothetical protein B0J14DRAFT_563393 [Halenospora varia]|nr:hypothetical protein B0J14DRAFT_563393 [Halenospora varia]